MARSRKIDNEPTEVFPLDQHGPGAARRWGMQFALPLLLGAGLLGGLLWAGYAARQRLGPRSDEAPAFADLECDAPPGLTRRQFLDEAQYLAGLPDRLSLREPGAADRLATGLAQHPWVERVERIDRSASGRLRATLTFRRPALAIAEPARVVDARGALLPLSAPREGLPVLSGPLPPPGKPGQVWPDARVKAAARVAGLLGPHLEELRLKGCRVEVDRGEVTLRAARAVVLWGSAPGREKLGEAKAADKLTRLRTAPVQSDQLLDLRPAAGAVRQAWAP